VRLGAPGSLASPGLWLRLRYALAAPRLQTRHLTMGLSAGFSEPGCPTAAGPPGTVRLGEGQHHQHPGTGSLDIGGGWLAQSQPSPCRSGAVAPPSAPRPGSDSWRRVASILRHHRRKPGSESWLLRRQRKS